MLCLLHINTPKCKIIEYSSDQYTEMIFNIEKLSFDDDDLNKNVNEYLKPFPFILLMEYIPSLNLYELGQKTTECFKDDHHNSRNYFIKLGRIILFNIFSNNPNCNNFQFLSEKIISNHVKTFLNPDNILFEVILDELIPNTNFKELFTHNIKNNSLDLDTEIRKETNNYIFKNSICLLNPAFDFLDSENKENLTNIGDYLNYLSTLFEKILSDMNFILLKKGYFLEDENKYNDCLQSKNDIPNSRVELNNSTFNNKEFSSLFSNKLIFNIKQIFQKRCGWQLTNKNIFYIYMGMIVLINDINEIDIEDIKKIIDFVKTKSIRRDDEKKSFSTSEKSISLSYFRYIINFFKKLKIDNKEIFEWVEDVSLGIYNYKFSKGIHHLLKTQEEFLTEFNNGNINFNHDMYKMNDFKEKPKLKENNKDISSLETRAIKENDKMQNNIVNDKNPIKNFLTDVKNGVYEYVELTNDMIMERKKIDDSNQAKFDNIININSTNKNVLNQNKN